ncbi:MAG: 3-oxoacyl-ACP reductase FabG [Planctomycetes bacterium]|nr:3-oxoacyl-ACP reductase FabG [Planctomycetota bacterium]
MPAEREAFDFTGQVAWVTGASRGIGLAVARAFHGRGAKVVGLDLDVSPELRAFAAQAVELDVSSTSGVSAACAALAKQGLAPDALVNNAGVTRDSVVWKMSEESWDLVLDVNLKGAFNLTREALPLMREKQQGAVVCVSSINGLRGKFGQSNYAASKAGLIGFAKSVAREAGKFGVRVNVVAPGMVETEMAQKVPPEIRQKALDETLLGRLAAPEDIANAVLFLSSGLGKHITGQVLQVDGGQYL